MKVIDQVKEIEDFLSGEKNVWSWFFDNPFIGIAICNHKSQIISVNNAHYYICGISKEDSIGKNMIDYEKTGIVDRAITPLVVKSKRTILTEQYTNSKRFIVQSKPVMNKQGDVKYVIHLLFDVSLENQLRRILEKKDEREDLLTLKKMEEWKVLFDSPKEKKLIFQSKAMEDVMKLVEHIATADAPVLITGDSGVGKEVVAREIHDKGKGKDKPFIAINCGAIPETLLESELFGYEPGAFTNSHPNGKKGLFEVANGGTIFLDEIGELPYGLQVKLLRVLQERIFRKIGGITDIPCNLRIVSATNSDLVEMIKNKSFRKDLYYRLNVIPIYIPPLSKRRDDILILSCYFLNHYCDKYNKTKKFNIKGFNQLSSLKFEGNVRELQHLIERLVLLSESNTIGEEDVLSAYKQSENDESSNYLYNPFYEGNSYKEIMENVEKQLLTYFSSKGKSSYEIAEALEISQPTVWRKLKKYGV